MDKPENPPAFPMQLHGSDGFTLFDKGMLLRDYFAAAAVQGLIGRNWSHIEGDLETILQWAQSAYATADAMLAERAKGGANG